MEDIIQQLFELELNSLGIHSHSDYLQCKKDLKNFIWQALDSPRGMTYSTYLDQKAIIIVTLAKQDSYVEVRLTLLRKFMTSTSFVYYDKNYMKVSGKVDWDDLFEGVWSEIVCDINYDASIPELNAMGVDAYEEPDPIGD